MKKHINIISLLCVCVLLAASCAAPAAPQQSSEATGRLPISIGTRLLGPDALIHYLVGQDPTPGTLNWAGAEYSDSAWQRGSGSFGAKNNELAALGSYMPDNLLPMSVAGSSEPVSTWFFRVDLTIDDLSQIPSLKCSIAFDDAVIAYINGQQVFASNLPAEGYTQRLAFGAEAALDEPRSGEFTIPQGMLRQGKNVVAFELHQAAASSSDCYIGLVSLEVCEAVQSTIETQGLCLFTGGQTSLTARWLGDGSEMSLYIKEAGSTDAEKAIPAKLSRIDTEPLYRYSAYTSQLKADTEYEYYIQSALGRSRTYIAKTAGHDFSFLLAGDPQLMGDSSAKALSHALSLDQQAAFVLCPGDLTDSSTKSEQYRAFLSTPALSSLCLAPVKGNHEGDELYDFYFGAENVASLARDYCFTYANTLFVMLDTSNTDISAHRDFLRQSIGDTAWDWVIVGMHKSVFGAGAHADEAGMDDFQREYAALFSALDVDLVLSGHDHYYARTQSMENLTPTGSGTALTDGQCVYISAGSSTGSKYYELMEGINGKALAFVGEAQRASVTKLAVTSHSIEIQTLYTDDGSVADSVTLTHASPPQAMNTQTDNMALLAAEREYLLSTALSNGALSTYSVKDSSAAINPYFASYTALALLNMGELTTVKAYMDWHFAHLNSSDADINALAYTIYDYKANAPGTIVSSETSLRSYDSVDSYAAVFLSLLNTYRSQSGDSAYILAHQKEICGIAQLLIDVSEDGMTLTKPDYKVQYLMDNCEALRGVRDAYALIVGVILPTLEGEALSEAQTLTQRIRSLEASIAYGLEFYLWDASAMRYNHSRQSNGYIPAYDGGVFYPDSVSQLFPIVCGHLDPRSYRAKLIYNDFCTRWQWEKLSILSNGKTNSYWGVCAYAAAVMGDSERLSAYAAAYGAATASSHSYPLFNADSAWLVSAILYKE